MERSSDKARKEKEMRRTEEGGEATRPEQGPGMRRFIYVDGRETENDEEARKQ